MFGVIGEVAKISKMFYDTAMRYNNDKESIGLFKECLFVIFNSICEGGEEVMEFYEKFEGGIIIKYVGYVFEVYEKEYDLVKAVLGGVVCMLKGNIKWKGVLRRCLEEVEDVIRKYKCVDKDIEVYVDEIECVIGCD